MAYQIGSARFHHESNVSFSSVSTPPAQACRPCAFVFAIGINYHTQWIPQAHLRRRIMRLPPDDFHRSVAWSPVAERADARSIGVVLAREAAVAFLAEAELRPPRCGGLTSETGRRRSRRSAATCGSLIGFLVLVSTMTDNCEHDGDLCWIGILKKREGWVLNPRPPLLETDA